jgi:hypothetical protein
MPVSGRRRSIRTAHLCRGYASAPGTVSISYAAMRIFGSNSSPFGPMEIGRWLTF